MHSTPLVSVVMASYNYGRFLRRAVGSVLAQTVRDLELIVVDDGSTDDSREIARSYLGDGRVRLVCNRHLGQPACKNAGVRLAAAPFVAFLDADDAWLPTKLQRQLDVFRRNPSAGVVYSRRHLIDPRGKRLSYRQPPLYRGDVLDRLYRDNFVCFSSAVVRRAVLDHVGLFDESVDVAIDYDLWLRVASHYSFDYADEPLVEYRVGHGNLSKRVRDRLATVLLLMQRCRDRRPHLGAAVGRRAQADTLCHMGLVLRPNAPAAALRWFARALAEDPLHRPTWRALAGLLVPRAARRLLRAAVGKRHDWEAALATSENHPRNL